MEEKDNVLDISTDDKERIKILETTIGIRMSKAEHAYLKSQTDSSVPRSDKSKILCFATTSDLDPVWVEQEINKTKLETYQEKQTPDTKESQRIVQGDAGDNIDDDKGPDFEVNKGNVLTVIDDSADVNQNAMRKRRICCSDRSDG